MFISLGFVLRLTENVTLVRISLDEFNTKDMGNLQKALDADPLGDPHVVYDKLTKGTATPWRYSTPKGDALFILEENQDHNEKYIFVWYMGGEGVVGYAEYVVEALCEYAKLRNCSSVRSFSLPGIAKYMKRFGFKPQMVAMRKEI